MSEPTPGHDQIARAYRRLLWAFPRWYRRERGAELLTTLLDDARPGQRRPDWLDVFDLARSGLRARLRPPRRVYAYLATVIGALYLAIVGAAAAVHLSPYPGPPTEAQAIATAVAATGVTPRDLPGPVVRCDAGCPPWEKQDADWVVAYDSPPEDPDWVSVHYDPPWEDAAAMVARARERLGSTGWQVSRLSVESSGVTHFTATRGHLSLSVISLVPPAHYRSTSVELSMTKTVSATTELAFAGGILAGLATGWPMSVWLLQKLRRTRLQISSPSSGSCSRAVPGSRSLSPCCSAPGLRWTRSRSRSR